MKRKDDSIINKIAAAVAHNAGQTGAELSQLLGMPTAYRRLSEIAKLGLVKREGQRRCNVSGRMAAIWFPCDRPPTPDRGELTPHQEIMRLKSRIEYLEKEVLALKLCPNR